MKTAAFALASFVLAAFAGCDRGDDSAATTTTTTEAPPVHYTLASTSRCLRAKGATVGRLRPVDPRLRAMRDLAQRTSHEVGVEGSVVGIAFLDDEGGAALLNELLRVPNDAYRLVNIGNVVVMSRKTDPAAHATVVDCLRP